MNYSFGQPRSDCCQQSIDTSAHAQRLFSDFFQLLLQGASEVLARREWYACELSFAYASAGSSALVVSLCSGPIRLGQLLNGWQSGALRATAECDHPIFITSFSINVARLPGRCTKFCKECKTWYTGELSNDEVQSRIDATRRLLKDVPPIYRNIEEKYASYAFSWSGLRPVTKTRFVRECIFKPASFDVVIESLRQLVEDQT
jgi:hypothetical protein